MRIQVLPPQVAAKIAAGEVVERPASAVKELIENAIDAGATEIAVEIREGGKRLIRVADNGIGILAEDVELAFARHSTSKLRTAEDLEHVMTLGFRGEALASIAAVAQVTLVTRAAEETVGTRLRLEGGKVLSRESWGGPQGTVVTVENLYYNTPARRKFLRSDATEASKVAELLTNYAFAYPELRFTLVSNGRTVLQTFGTGELRDVLLQVYGVEVLEKLIPFRGEDEGLSASGYISVPSFHRANRQDMVFFVNRRWVHDRSLSYAVEEACHDLLPTGRYPLAIVDVRLDPSEVDVNIHPTKREVRFRDSQRVFATVQRAVRHALQEHAPIASLRSQATPAGESDWLRRREALAHPNGSRPWSGQLGLELQRTADTPPREAVALSPLPASRLPMLRVIGQIAETYIIAEGPGGMYLIDQHAAHERVIYERLLAEEAAAQIAMQTLLEPLLLELAPAQAQVLAEHLPELETLGFRISPFGANTYRVEAVPAALAGGDIRAAIREILEQPRESGRPWREEALIAVVCHSAVRAGKPLSLPEMRDLVRQLEETSAPHSCPHGRPTMIHLSAAQLEREFGRR